MKAKKATNKAVREKYFIKRLLRSKDLPLKYKDFAKKVATFLNQAQNEPFSL